MEAPEHITSRGNVCRNGMVYLGISHLLLGLRKMVFKIRRGQLCELFLGYLPSELRDLLSKVSLRGRGNSRRINFI